MRTAAQWKELYRSPEFLEKYTYDGHDLGASCSETETVFRLWSPYAQAVTLRLYADGGEGTFFEKRQMEQAAHGVWFCRAAGDLHGVYYDYELIIDGEEIVSADPYARACGVNGVRSMAVNLRRTDPEGWETDCAPPRQTENIIYELNVKEFSWDKRGGFPEEYRGKYKAFQCTDTVLDGGSVGEADARGGSAMPTGCSYLRRLGVTHVQLMPVYDFGSVDEAGRPDDFNWGYDPVNHSVPEGSYSTDPYHGEVRLCELKELVQSLHRQGFRVIMDVVYNHTYHLDSWLQRTVPWYYYRADAEGRPTDGSACGNDVASERPMCAEYILDSVLYWAREYHMDGFRFDLMGLLDTELMNRISRALEDTYGPGEKLIYGEPWAGGDTIFEDGKKGAEKENLTLLDERIGVFCDNTRNAVKGSVFDTDLEGFVNGGEALEQDILKSARAWQGTEELPVSAPSQIITYVSAHDNQTLWDKLLETVPEEALRRPANRLAAAIYMTCQGSLFLLSGEEFARTKNGLHDSFDAPIALNCLDWGRAWEERELVNYYRGLIALRKRLPGLCDKTRGAGERFSGMWTKEKAAGFLLDNRVNGPAADERAGWSRLCIVYNAGKESVTVELPGGEWEILADGSSSFLWQNPPVVSGCAEAAAVSALILGRK